MDSNRRFSCLGTSWGHQDAVSNRGNLGVGCNFHRGLVQLRTDFYFVSGFCKEWSWSYFAHSRYPNVNSTFRNYWCSSVSTYKMLSTEFGEKTELWLHTSSYKALYYSVRHGKSSSISNYEHAQAVTGGLAHYRPFWVCARKSCPSQIVSTRKMHWSSAPMFINLRFGFFLLLSPSNLLTHQYNLDCIYAHSP